MNVEFNNKEPFYKYLIDQWECARALSLAEHDVNKVIAFVFNNGKPEITFVARTEIAKYDVIDDQGRDGTFFSFWEDIYYEWIDVYNITININIDYWRSQYDDFDVMLKNKEFSGVKYWNSLNQESLDEQLLCVHPSYAAIVAGPPK